MNLKLFLTIAVLITSACLFDYSRRSLSEYDILIHENVEALTDGELNFDDPVWIVYVREDGGFNSTRGGNQVC